MSAALLTDKSRSLGRRGKLLVATLAATVASAFAMAAMPVSSANAAYFCYYVTIGPNGQCHLPQSLAQDIWIIKSHGVERASCVALLGYYGEQLDSWVCAAAGHDSSYTVAPWRPFGYYRSAVKNNNLSKSGQFYGEIYCCNPGHL